MKENAYTNRTKNIIRMDRRKFVRWFGRGSVGLALGYPIFIEPDWIDLQQVQVSIKGLPKELYGLRIGFLTDFHRGRFVSENDISHAVNMLKKQNPDIILFGGDFVDGDSKYIKSCAKILSSLKAPLGVFAVLGNHDYWTDPKKIESTLKNNNIRVLINESIELLWKGVSFYIVGIDSCFGGRPDIKSAFKDAPNDAMKILLIHEPDFADNIKKYKKWIPLQLSGHSHGGQISLPFIGAPVLPVFGKKYPVGLQYVSGTDRIVYTSKGVGFTLPVRFNCRPEVTILALSG